MDERMIRETQVCHDTDHTVWFFCPRNRALISGENTILLTRTESQIVNLFLSSNHRPISKSLIAVGIEKCPDNYNGLLMTLSRLRRKFSAFSNGETLFKSVRNRGYCLTQLLKPLPYRPEDRLSATPGQTPANP